MNVGDYVRTNKGIAKYIGKYDDYEGFYEFDKLDDELWSGDISNVVYSSEIDNIVIKSSPNIIDLIEVGDYVNGEKVCYLKGDINDSEVAHKEDVLYTEYNDEYGEWYGYAEDEIETIATKEQFEAIQYKLEEE